MTKCAVCNVNEAEFAWQPLGPGENADVFTTLGSHYRGFPVVKICDKCRTDVKRGQTVTFTLTGRKYSGNVKGVRDAA